MNIQLRMQANSMANCQLWTEWTLTRQLLVWLMILKIKAVKLMLPKVT